MANTAGVFRIFFRYIVLPPVISLNGRAIMRDRGAKE